MDKDQVQLIMKEISDTRAETLRAIGELHQQFSGFKGGMDVRVKTVEDRQADMAKRQWYHSTIVFAGGVLHHSLAQWFGWKL
jgi:hypothetical protein